MVRPDRDGVASWVCKTTDGWFNWVVSSRHADLSTPGWSVHRGAHGVVDGDALELSIVAPPRSGTVTLVGDCFVYKPNADFHGDDELVFIASDGEQAIHSHSLWFNL